MNPEEPVPKDTLYLANGDYLTLGVGDFWSPLDEAEEVYMNRALIVVALAVVTFFQGFLGSLIVGGVTDLSVSALEAAAVGAVGGAISVLANGVGKLHAYLAERAAL